MRGTDVLLGAAVRLYDLARVLLYLSPHFLAQAAPIAFLLALLIGLGRMADDGELVALQSLGVRPSRLVWGPVWLSVYVSLGLLVLAFTAQPWGLRGMRRLGDEIVGRNLVNEVKPRRFHEELSGLVLYAEKVEANGHWTNVLVEDGRSEKAPMLMVAREARVEPAPAEESIGFHLIDGEAHQLARGEGNYSRLAFENGDLHVYVGDTYWSKNRLRSWREEMTPIELLDAAREARERGEDGLPMEMAVHWRLSQAMAPLAFALVGTPLSLVRRRGGRARGVVLSLAGYVGWYLLARACVGLGEKGQLDPLLAGLLPNLLFILGGALALWRFDARGRA
jgi:lipopolysaccharide export system permease protein